MSFSSIVSYLEPYRQRKIEQHNRQLKLSESLVNCKCDTSKHFRMLHDDMINKGIELMNASYFDTFDVINKQLDSRDKLLDIIEEKVKNKSICE